MVPFAVFLYGVTPPPPLPDQSQPILHGVKYRHDVVPFALGMEPGLEQRGNGLFSPFLLLLLFLWETEELLNLKLQQIWLL